MPSKFFAQSIIVLALAVSPAFTQTTTTGQVVGQVQDATGAVVPNATLRLENTATGIVQTTTASTDGGFVFPSVQPGTYNLTAELTGFETAVFRGIVVNAGRTTDQPVTLKVGSVTERVEITGAAPALQLTNTTVATTVEQKYLQDLPLPGREVLPFALLTAGAQQGVTARDSTFEGMPGASINITLNGISNNAQRFKSGGTSFFNFVANRLETVEEVTISTSNLGADSTGQGAMQIQVVSKQGSNSFHGEAFWQHQNSALNGNNWFNNANRIKRPLFIQNDQGGTIGGPILKNRLFFFLSYAHVITPESGAYQTLVLTPAAQSGDFTYVGSDGVTRTVNLLALAARNGFPGTVNPVIGAQLQKIQTASTSAVSSFSDPIRNQLRWVTPAPRVNYFPMARFDYQISSNLRLSVSDTYNHNVNQTGFRGTTLPGSFEAEQSYGQISNPYIATAGVTWTATPTIVNEFVFGIQSNQETFNTGFRIETFQPRLMVFPLGLASGLEQTNGLGFGNTYQSRNNPVYNLVDNVHWQKGDHSFRFGGNLIRTTMHQETLGSAGIPTFRYGLVASDPAANVFNTTSLPAIGANSLADAQNLYALLTGRISNVTSVVNVDAASHQFVPFNPVQLKEVMTSFGIYFSDSWRLRRTLTLNYGLRWDFQGNNQNPNDIYTSPTPLDLFGPSGAAGGNTPNLFRPGSLSGIANPAIYQRSQAYNSDYVNPAPHIGLAWNPKFTGGLLGGLLGDGKTVFRAGYSLSYYSEGLLNFTNLAGNNPGLRQNATLTSGVDFTPGLSVGDPLPAFNFFPRSFSFPLPTSNFAFTTTAISTMDPDIRAPYVQTWSVGIQRELNPGTVLEVRYAGNRGVRLWHTYNVNEVNIYENGFLDQFRAAQRNLAVNQANGRGNSFANNGLAGQTAIPVFETAFTGQAAAFTNSTFLSYLNTGQAGAFATSLAQTATYFCRMVGNNFSPCATRGFNTPGAYPINFFVLNPFQFGGTTPTGAPNANFISDNSFSNYHALQLEFRKRFSQGLTVNVNYAWSHSLTDRFNKNVDNSSNFSTLRYRAMDVGPSPFDIRHVLQAFGTYNLPFGRGRRFAINQPVLDAIAGGWTIGSIFRLQTGLPFKLSGGQLTVNQQDAGVTPKVTSQELQSNVGVYRTGNPYVYFVNPQLIGSDGRSNTSVLAPPSVPGEFGSFIYLYGPRFVSDDLSIAKELPILGERLRAEFRAEMVNVFNHPIFQVPTGGTFAVTPVNISSTTFGRSTATTTLPRQVQFRLRFVF